MARVLYGGVGLQGLSGSINSQAGGHTFTKNNVVRRRVIPTNPQSSTQQAVRAAFLFLSASWKDLSAANQSAWEEARCNEPYYYKQDPLTGVTRKYASAKALFVAMNLNYLVANEAIDTPAVTFNAPGADFSMDDLAITSVVLDASAGSVTITYTGTQTFESMTLYATPPGSPGNLRATSVKSLFRYVNSNFGVSPYNAGTFYTNLFGAITACEGKKVFWEVWGTSYDTGKSRLIAASADLIVA